MHNSSMPYRMHAAFLRRGALEATKCAPHIIDPCDLLPKVPTTCLPQPSSPSCVFVNSSPSPSWPAIQEAEVDDFGVDENPQTETSMRSVESAMEKIMNGTSINDVFSTVIDAILDLIEARLTRHRARLANV